MLPAMWLQERVSSIEMIAMERVNIFEMRMEYEIQLLQRPLGRGNSIVMLPMEHVRTGKTPRAEVCIRELKLDGGTAV